MKILEKKKLYKGLAEIKDYELKDAILRNQEVKFIYNGQYMILSPTKLKKDKIFINTQKSIINDGQTYAVYGFRWQRQGLIDRQLEINYNVKKRLAQEWRKIMQSKNETNTATK